jgi:hypothetical protein
VCISFQIVCLPSSTVYRLMYHIHLSFIVMAKASFVCLRAQENVKHSNQQLSYKNPHNLVDVHLTNAEQPVPTWSEENLMTLYISREQSHIVRIGYSM